MGEIHPIVVHLAVTLLFAAPLLFWLTKMPVLFFLKDLVGPLNGLGSGIGIFALWTGWQLANTGFYAGEDFESHRFLAFSVVIIGSIATIFLLFNRHQNIFSDYLIKVLLLVQGVLIVATGNKGGMLTHGDKPWIKTPHSLSLNKMEGSFTIYDGLIQPIFDLKCIACHQETNKNGGLSLVNFESLMEGGSSGPVIQSGEVNQSLLFERITLSKSSTKYMPPTGWPLNYDEINLIAHWIATGAKKEANLIDHPLTDMRLVSYVEEAYGIKNGFQSKIEKQNGPMWTEEVENILKKYPQYLQRIAVNTNWVSLKIDSFYSADILEEFSNITTSIAWIDAGKSNITLEDFALLGALPNLVRLSLDFNKWDNQAVSQLVNYPSIEFLNLYANPVGEEGIIQLLNEKISLNKLIIGATQVEEGEKSGIIKNYPGVEIL